MIHDHLALNHRAVGCLVIMGIALVFFATALRSQLRSGEAREATYSNVAYGGLLLASAGLSQMVMWNWGLINGAADAKDDAALHISQLRGLLRLRRHGYRSGDTFIACGLAGLNNAVLPSWFSIVTLVMGVLSALGGAGIPPGGLVNYVLLPFWLIAAAAILARRQKMTSEINPPRNTVVGHPDTRTDIAPPQPAP